MTDAHNQKITNSYIVHFPDHAPRENDPHYKDFEHYRKQTEATARCQMGENRGDFSECNGRLELHHSHIEFSLQNAVELKWLEKAYPGVSDPDKVGQWVESADNLIWLCEKCHRGVGGIHHASAADYEAEKFVRNLIDKEDNDK
jgi:hypothetical protein